MAPNEIISIATPQCCVPADGSAHAEIVEPVHETIVESVIESTAPAEAATAELALPAPASVVEKPATAAEQPMPAPLTPVPVAPASAEQPVPAPQFKTAKEILEESAAKEAADAKAAEEAKAAAKAKAADEVLAEEEAAKPAEEEPADTVEKEKPAAEEAPEEEPATEEPEEEPATEEPKEKPAAEEPADEEENLFDETDGDAGEKAEPAKEKSEEPKAEDDPFAGILRAPSEPVRRWIDNTGVHETIGRLVEVHPDCIRILKANGRHATVPFTRLSRHDQDYVNTTGARIAAEQRSQPAVHDTAGL